MDTEFKDDLSNEDYHSNKGISKTTLDLASSDPHKVAWAKTCPVDSDKLKTFDFGDAMHAICLEPDRLKSEFVVMPALNLRTNAGKAERDEFVKAHTEHKILTADESKQLNLMFESVMAHREARALIEAEGIAEGSYFWADKDTGLLCKCRPDKNIVNEGLLVDVKTTPDLKKFAYSVDDYRYYVQDPWYCDGVTHVTTGQVFRMEFLVIQKTIDCGRYPVEVLRLPEEAIEYGREIYRRDLDKYAEFMQLEQPPETRELDMGFRFNQKIEMHYGEVL